jgi:AmmeMemoRadiSam system protein A
LTLARAAIAERYGAPKVQRPPGSWLEQPRAVFVTLKLEGELRGCIGQLVARLPLFEAVREAAHGAAFTDPRFSPLEQEELVRLRIDVSVLSALEPLEVRDEEELLAKLRPGVDGVVLSHEFRSGLFIPEMWKQLPEPREFVTLLKRKAGFPRHVWLPGTKVHRFTAEHWEEGP